MCGFFGYIGLGPHDEERLGAAAGANAYRGLDGHGLYRDGLAYLSHHRLSIIDLAEGRQPMTSRDGRHTIVFSGEIYNYLELRKELEDSGAVFRTSSDTEVLLEGFVRQGAAFLGRLEGMYAFGIWDALTRNLHLGRDLLGKKPLHVWTDPSGAVVFSTTLHAFRSLDGWTGRLNPLATVLFTAKGFIPAPVSIFEGCRKVMPGFLESFSLDTGAWTRQRVQRFTFPSSWARVFSGGKAREMILGELRRSVAMRCRADVPMGLTFSGGVDSGLIACLLREAGLDLPLFNVDYETGSNRSPERRNARLAAQKLGFKLTEIDFEPSNLFLELPQAYRHYDEPCNQLTMVYYYGLCRRIKEEGITVALSGNGSDEFFFGYNGNRIFRKHNFLVSKLPFMLPEVLVPQRHAAIRKRGWKNFVTGEIRHQLGGAGKNLGLDQTALVREMDSYLEIVGQEVESAGFSEFQDYFAWHELRLSGAGNSNYILPDISGLQAQIEVRSPFLDMGFINHVGRLHIRNKIGSMLSDRHNKSVLKKLYAERVGQDIAYDTKRGLGFNVRFDLWIRQEPQVVGLFRDVLARLGDFGIDPAQFLRGHEMFCDFEKYRGAGGDQAVTGFMLSSWLIKEFEGEETLDQVMDQARGFSPGNMGLAV